MSLDRRMRRAHDQGDMTEKMDGFAVPTAAIA
jgi:hypothetical protein